MAPAAAAKPGALELPSACTDAAAAAAAAEAEAEAAAEAAGEARAAAKIERAKQRAAKREAEALEMEEASPEQEMSALAAAPADRGEQHSLSARQALKRFACTKLLSSGSH